MDFQKIFQTYEGFGEAMSIYNKDLEGWQTEKQKMIDDLAAKLKAARSGK